MFVFYQLLACWKLFSASPTQITIDNPRYPISKIDFPAVTLCPVNKVSHSKMIKLMERYVVAFTSGIFQCYRAARPCDQLPPPLCNSIATPQSCKKPKPLCPDIEITFQLHIRLPTQLATSYRPYFILKTNHRHTLPAK